MKNFKRIIILILVLMLGLTLTACQTTTDGASTTTDYTDLSIRYASGENGVVASASPYASKAGLTILEQGGNAFDAACAVAFALGVVEPHASGIGGGGIMVAYNASEGEYVSYNFREFVPAAGTAETYQAKYLENGGDAQYQTDASEVLSYGSLSIGVPTEVAGLLKIIEEVGSGNVTRQDILAPAISYARDGFVVTKELGDTIATNMKQLLDSKKETKDVFIIDGFTIEAGETLIQEDYADTLELIAEEGAEGFYTGEVAEAIVEAIQSQGGIITLDDLEYAMNNYPVKSTPVTGTYNGYEIASSNVPSSGGTILVETLNLLEEYTKTTGNTLKSLGHNSSEYINVLATALQLAYGDKRKYIADTVNDSNITNYISTLTSKEYASYRWAGKYTYNKAYNNLITGDDYYGDIESFLAGDTDIVTTDGVEPDEHYSTTTFSVADKWGNIVSVTQTINHFFGSGIVPHGCGFFLNNQLGSLSFSTSSVNYIKPYKQPVSHIMPTIVTKDGLPYATLGSPGSMRIPSAVVQTFLNLVEFDMSMQDAIAAERIFVYSTGGGDDESSVEDGKMLWIETSDETLVNKLRSMGYYIPSSCWYSSIHLYFGGVQGIKFDYSSGKGIMTGGADPRRDGKALAF